jgi:hypothetical protein
LSLLGVVFFMLVMIGAFAVQSAAGFGAVLIAMPMLAFVLPVSTAVSVTTALTAITSVHQVSRDWRRVAWRHFAIMAFYSAIGIGEKVEEKGGDAAGEGELQLRVVPDRAELSFQQVGDINLTAPQHRETSGTFRDALEDEALD